MTHELTDDIRNQIEAAIAETVAFAEEGTQPQGGDRAPVEVLARAALVTRLASAMPHHKGVTHWQEAQAALAPALCAGLMVMVASLTMNMRKVAERLDAGDEDGGASALMATSLDMAGILVSVAALLTATGLDEPLVSTLTALLDSSHG